MSDYRLCRCQRELAGRSQPTRIEIMSKIVVHSWCYPNVNRYMLAISMAFVTNQKNHEHFLFDFVNCVSTNQMRDQTTRTVTNSTLGFSFATYKPTLKVHLPVNKTNIPVWTKFIFFLLFLCSSCV